jgi:hypothetical protein
MFYFPIKFIKKTSKLGYEFQTLSIDLDEKPSEQATVQSTFFFDNPLVRFGVPLPLNPGVKKRDWGEIKLTTAWKKLIIRSCFRLLR